MGGGVRLGRDLFPWSESLLIGCQVLFSSLVGLQSLDGVDILRQLGLPPHQDLLLLQILQTLQGAEQGAGLQGLRDVWTY